MKERRQLTIKELINQHVVETQEQLVMLLREANFDVTQATVSRDIKELHLIKVLTAEGHYKYALPEQRVYPLEKLRRTLVDYYVHIDAADNLVVMRCLPGTANAIGSLIDQMDWEELLGTICGDDTILLICRSKDAGELLMQRVFDIMAGRLKQ